MHAGPPAQRAARRPRALSLSAYLLCRAAVGQSITLPLPPAQVKLPPMLSDPVKGDADCCDFILKMLDKNPVTRLGSGPSDASLHPQYLLERALPYASGEPKHARVGVVPCTNCTQHARKHRAFVPIALPLVVYELR